MRKWTTILCVFLLFTNWSCHSDHHKLARNKKSGPKKISNREQRQKLTVKKKKMTGIAGLLASQEQKNKTECPSKSKKKYKTSGELQSSKEKIKGEIDGGKASLSISYETLEFDVVYLEKSSLDIPTFKQFKNNMTDFTADGEKEFQLILSKIRVYLGDNTDGDGVSLRIWGSASQIPTSFDPSKPNNNIHPDGRSIRGKTSIENNRLLAHARAQELAKKIKAVFVKIDIQMPTLDKIKVGETKWTSDVQRALDEAYLAGDKQRMEEIFEPFQKEQFVKVESDEIFMKAIQPNKIKMYTMIAAPRFKFHGEEIRSKYIISKQTYDFLSSNELRFESEEERTKYLKKNGFHLKSVFVDHKQRWYLYKGKEELDIITNGQSYDRILASHQNEIVDKRDYDILEHILTEQALQEKKFKYVALKH